MISVLLYAPVWMIGGCFRRRRRPQERAMRVWPLIAVVSLILFMVIFVLCSSDIINRLGNVTVWSLGIFITTLVFAAASLLSAITAWRVPVEGVRRWVRIFSISVSLALLIATAYFVYFGVIGLRTWA
jgi:small-conductance mechanosensitive channel